MHEASRKFKNFREVDLRTMRPQQKQRPALELNQLLLYEILRGYGLSHQGLFRGQITYFVKTSKLKHDRYIVVKQKSLLVDEYVVRV